MKKLLTALLAAGILSTCALSAISEERPFIALNTKASKEFAPNVANVKFYIETSDKDLNKATQTNKEETQKALNAVKKMLDSAKGDSIKTVNFNVNPEYSYKNNAKTFVQYNVTNGFEVTIKNTDKLGDIIAQGLKNGATRVDDLNFSLDNTEAACNALISEAIGLAKTRADQTARSAGSSVLGIKMLQTNCSGDSGVYPQFRMMNSAKYAQDSMSESAATGAVPTEMGTIKLYATVNAQYFIK